MPQAITAPGARSHQAPRLAAVVAAVERDEKMERAAATVLGCR